mgnify:CR=1 FL=1
MSQINKSARQVLAPILSNKRVGQYHQIIVSVGDIAAQCKPGNFVAISVGGDSSRMVLRRAFAISRVSTSSTVGGTMELIVAPHGQGSKWLCAQGEGVTLDIVAPLGTAFGIPTEPVPVLLERDFNIPQLSELEKEVKHLEQRCSTIWSKKHATA